MAECTVLVVEDELAIRDMLRMALELGGFGCIEAENIQDAYTLVVDERPDIVLLDWMLPGGSGLGFEPVFVECAAGSIVLHTTKEPQRIRRADLATEKAFISLLDQVAESQKKSVIFLVRDDGLSTYRTVRDLATAHEARHGKLPVIGQGRLNLGYFTDK
jgi:DNA-binding NtrC family response regulator